MTSNSDIKGARHAAPPVPTYMASSSGGNSVSLHVSDLSFSQKVTLVAIISVCGAGIVLLSIYLCHVLVSAYLYHRRRLIFTSGTQQHHLQGAAAAATRGLDPDVLESLPVFAYSTATHDCGLDCSVCLGEFLEGDKVRALPGCKHTFHKECIDMWLGAHSTCPLCRQAMGSKN